jgi:lysophospholipase L1-like esterase
MFTSKVTRSQEGGAPSTIRICSPIGNRISSAGTQLTLDGALIEHRTSSGAWRTASWTRSTPRSWFCSPGTNNVGDLSAPGGTDARADDITRGIQAIVHLIREKALAATIIVMGIFPRNDNIAFAPLIDRINRNLSELADGQKIRYLNINDKLTNSDGRLLDGMMSASDKLHPTLKAYQVWADALKPVLTELLGPPAALDHAPPPAGDPATGH